jgi:hypothetical protein
LDSNGGGGSRWPTRMRSNAVGGGGGIAWLVFGRT